MPIYKYRCESCGNVVEVFQKINDDPLETCETCGGELKKMIGNIGVVFKGNGFYSTDSKKTSNGSSSSEETTNSTSKTND